MYRSFWLVQRLTHSPADRWKETFPDAKVRSNPFGYGRLGDYELDYMGAAEFEWGAIPKANNRLAEGTPTISVMEGFTYPKGGPSGRKKIKLPALDMLWLEEDGDPSESFQKWLDEGARTKESMGLFEYVLRGEEIPDYWQDTNPTAVWWAINANVQWAIREDDDSHLRKMLKSMEHVPAEFLR